METILIYYTDAIQWLPAIGQWGADAVVDYRDEIKYEAREWVKRGHDFRDGSPDDQVRIQHNLRRYELASTNSTWLHWLDNNGACQILWHFTLSQLLTLFHV